MTKNKIRPVFVNGRFLARPMTGVERVATEILRELAQLVAARPNLRLRLVVIMPYMPVDQRKTAQTVCDDLGLDLIFSQTKGYLWEQIELPLRTFGSVVLSFCNLGPVFKRKQLIVIHDAQVYTQPNSYRFLFRAIYKTLLPMLGRTSRQVVTVSDNTRQELENLRVLPRGKAHVIHNAANHVLRVKPAEKRLVDTPYFLVFGSRAAHKNVETVISAMAGFRKGDVPLVIAGGSNGRVFQAGDNENIDGITRLGRVSDAALVTLYTHATALIFPSLTEGFGLPPLEAMQLGCPVIVSDGGAIPEACKDAALYVSPLDVDGWAQAMRSLADSPELQAEMRSKGLRRAAEFSWERAAGLYLDLIVRMAWHGSGTAPEGDGQETQKSVSI